MRGAMPCRQLRGICGFDPSESEFSDVDTDAICLQEACLYFLAFTKLILDVNASAKKPGALAGQGCQEEG